MSLGIASSGGGTVDGLSGSRRRTAPAGAGGAAAGPWTSVAGRVAAARARSSMVTEGLAGKVAERCFLRRASPASIATREMRLLCTAIGTCIASLRMAASYDGGGKSQVAHSSLSRAPVAEARFRGRRSVHVAEVMIKTAKARTLPSSSCQCAASARRRGERCRAEALTHGDARIVKRSTSARKKGSSSYHSAPCCPTQGSPSRDARAARRSQHDGARAHQEALRLGLGSHHSTATMVKREEGGDTGASSAKWVI